MTTEKKNPFFSLLLPTFNRADFLPMAIESILRQTFGNFEIVISDGGSTDDTEAKVGAIKDDRIKYVRSEKRIDMAQNYQKAFDNSSGDFVVFFSDDDALLPSALAKLKHIIHAHDSQMVVFPFARYYHDDDYEPGRKIKKNSVLFAPFTRKILEKSGLEELLWLFSSYGLIKGPLTRTSVQPLIGNCAFPSSILREISERSSGLFPSVPIDIPFITMVLSSIETFHVVDEPLLVWSRWNNNSTPSAKLKGTLARQHYEKLLDGWSLNHSPFKFALPMNCGANAILHARELLGEKAPDVEIDWSNFFVSMKEYLSSLADLGMDVREEIEDFELSLAKQPDDVQRAVKWFGSGFFRFKLKRIMRRTLPDGILRLSKTVIGLPVPKVVHGEGKFADFLECAEYLEQNLGKFSSAMSKSL